MIRPRVVLIVGATATGKSDLGVEFARIFNGEVVSADSMQVYRGMDIGTAKLTHEEMRGVPHHLIDIVDPTAPFTVADWTRAADDAIGSITDRGKVPIVVGGTGLYIRAITEDLDFAEQPGSREVREKWQAFLAEEGTEALYRQLVDRDPVTAARLHPNDTRRVIRALEVYELHGPLSAAYDWRRQGGRYETLLLGLRMPREALYERVERRVDKMMELGLLEEVRGLLASGVPRQAQSMQAIGYKELAAHLDGEVSLDESVMAIKRATRRFVKRQTSWFGRDERIVWMDREPNGQLSPRAVAAADAAISNFLAGIPRDRRE